MLNPKIIQAAAAHIKRKIEHAEMRPVVQQLVVSRKHPERALRVKVNAAYPQ